MSEPSVRLVILYGNPIDGLSVAGPFFSASRAIEWASDVLAGETWWVTPLEFPILRAEEDS